MLCRAGTVAVMACMWARMSCRGVVSCRGEIAAVVACMLVGMCLNIGCRVGEERLLSSCVCWLARRVEVSCVV